MVGVLEVCSIGSWEMVGSSRADQQRDDSRNGRLCAMDQTRPVHTYVNKGELTYLHTYE